MKVKMLSSLILAVLCTALAGCTDTNEDTPVIYASQSETASPTETEVPEQTVGETVTGNTLMADAELETSAMQFLYYDGENVKSQWLFQNLSAKKEILKKISAVPAEKAEDWSPELFTAPAYGFEICDTGGWALEAVWSNGYWITQDGEAYRFDYDFSTFLDEYDWSDERVFSVAAELPCAHIICRDGEKWYTDRLSPAYVGESVPDYISAELVEQTEDKIKVKYTNNGSEEWMYGLYYSLDVLLDGEWYSVPTITGHWAFPSIGVILKPEQTKEEDCGLFMYGELPPGQYRVVANGCTVEFTVPLIMYN